MNDEEVAKMDYSKIEIDPSMRGVAPTEWEKMAAEFIKKISRDERLNVLHEIQYALAQMIAREKKE